MTIPLPGCRHDVLGHALKAVGVLRALAECAPAGARDRDAEGWWNLKEGCFEMGSRRYGDRATLTEFFANYYQPTPIIATWNKSGGITDKVTGKKGSTIPEVQRLLQGNKLFAEVLALARSYKPRFQGEGEDEAGDNDAFQSYRDQLPEAVSEALDALCAISLSDPLDNPVFVRRGRPGDKVNADIFLNFWDFFLRFRKHPGEFVAASLFGERVTPGAGKKDLLMGKGTPFFPDAIKSYNQGLEWVTEKFPFCPLDYVLAVEGGLALRGGVAKSLSAQGRPYAAFPFVFEGSDVMTDEQGNQLRMVRSFWFPLWTRPTTYDELKSFILDAQARLVSRDCRFSADFGRAVRSHGTDAGFAAFQEFRFKLKGANVPWTTAGRLVPTSGAAQRGTLSELLAPLDENRFLDQFRFAQERRNNLHPLREPVMDAIEAAVAEPSSSNLLEVLQRLAELNSRLATSKSLREKINDSENVAFVPPLPMDAWEFALRDAISDPEFRIARALASIAGQERQSNEAYSEVEPFLGSLLPLHRVGRAWLRRNQLTEAQKKGRPSGQSVASGTDLCLDLHKVLARRYQDSMEDDCPAVRGCRRAPLRDILKFLRGELDERRIGWLTLSLSHIDWHFLGGGPEEDQEPGVYDDEVEDTREPIPLAYGACRALIEVSLERPSHAEIPDQRFRRRPSNRSPGAISLITQHTATAVESGVIAALRRLAIVGVPNCYGQESRTEKSRLAGRDVVSLAAHGVKTDLDSTFCQRLAAAVLIPMDWRDKWKVYRSVTIPQPTRI